MKCMISLAKHISRGIIEILLINIQPQFDCPIFKIALNNCNILFSPDDIFHLTVVKPSSPILYGLPKIPKTNIHRRPVVPCCNAPAYKLCKKNYLLLRGTLNFNPKYTLNILQIWQTKLKTLMFLPSLFLPPLLHSYYPTLVYKTIKLSLVYKTQKRTSKT